MTEITVPCPTCPDCGLPGWLCNERLSAERKTWAELRADARRWERLRGDPSLMWHAAVEAGFSAALAAVQTTDGLYFLGLPPSSDASLRDALTEARRALDTIALIAESGEVSSLATVAQYRAFKALASLSPRAAAQPASRVVVPEEVRRAVWQLLRELAEQARSNGGGWYGYIIPTILDVEAALRDCSGAPSARLFKDGDAWCCLLGENLQEGLCGFGDTPTAAIEAFWSDLTRLRLATFDRALLSAEPTGEDAGARALKEVAYWRLELAARLLSARVLHGPAVREGRHGEAFLHRQVMREGIAALAEADSGQWYETADLARQVELARAALAVEWPEPAASPSAARDEAGDRTFPRGGGTGTYFRRLPDDSWVMLNSSDQWVTIQPPTWSAPARVCASATTPPAHPVPAPGADAVRGALANIIETRLLGINPDVQDVELEDDDWRIILAALASSPDQGASWQPIETAPKDQGEIQVWCRDTNEQFVVLWQDRWVYANGPFGSVGCDPDMWRPTFAAPALPHGEG